MFKTYTDITVPAGTEINLYSLIPKEDNKSLILQNKSTTAVTIRDTSSTDNSGISIVSLSRVTIDNSTGTVYLKNTGYSGAVISVTEIDTGITIEEVQEQIEEMQEWVQEQIDLRNHLIDDLNTRVDDQQVEIYSLDSRVTALESESTDLEPRVDTLETDVSTINTSLTSVDSRLDSLETHDTSTDSSISSLSSRMTTAESNISSNTTAISTKVNTSDVVDNLTSTSTITPLSANQGKVLKGLIDSNASSIGTNSSAITSLQTRMTTSEGNISTNTSSITSLQSSKVNISDVIDTLSSTETTKPLSANQGRVLNTSLSTTNGNVTSLTTRVTTAESNISSNTTTIGTKVNTSDIVDTLLSTSTVVPLSANQGKVLKGLVDTNTSSISTTNGNVSALTTRVTTAEGNITSNTTAIGSKINTSDIVNNVTSTSTVFPLAANQGTVLKGLIDNNTTAIGTKQDILVSGTNIKTINGTPILGSGNIVTNNDATTSVKGVIQLAGDLGGTASLPSVLKINGVTITGTPAYASTLVASSSTAAQWQGGLNNAGRVSSIGTLSQAATTSFANIVAGSAMTLTGNSTLYSGTTAGITCVQAGTYKVTITAHLETNANVYGDACVGVGGTAVGGTYRTFCSTGLLTGNDRNTVTFTELVTVTAGQVISAMFKSTATTTSCTGATIVVEKLS